MTEKSYAAFISYAHADERIAARLHRALETYPIPKSLGPKSSGDARRSDLSPIFRDAAELNAHHSLPDKIREAVNRSKFLIVLCSPAAKASHWVNEEIRLFRGLHGDASILCVLADGTPQTAFPPALTQGGREPLAANISGSRERFNLGVTGLAASMLGVGLDDLVQRAQKRRRRRGQFLTAGALGFSAIMGVMALTALRAQNAAETSRLEAEKMVEFMLTDLKSELEPLGKLSVLDKVGRRVSDYYTAIPLAQMDDDRIARRARARHLLGQVALDERDMETAKIEIEAAYDATLEVMRRNPDDTDAIFAHAQSAFWRGAALEELNDFAGLFLYWKEYDSLGARLYNQSPKDKTMIIEAASGQNNVGAALSKLGRQDESLPYYDAALQFWQQALTITPEDTSVMMEISNTLSNKSRDLRALNRYEDALSARNAEISVLRSALLPETNIDIMQRLYLSHLNLWELKNTTLEACDLSNPEKILSEYRSFINRDEDNIRWKVSYRAYYADFLLQCRKDMSYANVSKHLQKLRVFADEHGINDDVFKADMLRLNSAQ